MYESDILKISNSFQASSQQAGLSDVLSFGGQFGNFTNSSNLNPFGLPPNPFSKNSSFFHQASLSNNKLKSLGKSVPGMSLIQQTLVQNQHIIENLTKELSDKNNKNPPTKLVSLEKEVELEQVKEVEKSKKLLFFLILTFYNFERIEFSCYF